MNVPIIQTGCGTGCALSRRNVLATGLATGCAACLGDLSPFRNTASAQDAGENMRLRVIFSLHAPVQAVPDWPNIGFDFRPVMAEIMAAFKDGCKNIDCVSSMVNGPEKTKEIVEADNAAGNIDGYVVVQMNCWNQAVQTITETGKPVLYADFLYAGSGGFLVYTAGLLRAKKPNFAFMPSGRLADLVAAVNCMPLAKGAGGLKAYTNAVATIRRDCVAAVKEDRGCTDDKLDVLSTSDLLKELKTKKMLEYEKGWADVIPQTKETLGIEIIRRPFAELNDLWEKADKDQAQEIVNRWKKDAVDIQNVSDETLEKSARMYLAKKQCLKIHDACGITINCLGGFYGGHIHAYPCLGFHELLNEGLVGACECDTLSTLTMVVMTTLTKGRPGYISDPVMDVAAKQIIYAHCVAANKPFGPNGASNPFTIMTHSEDRQGASLRSTLPLGYMTTTLEMHPLRKEILFHQAITAANSTEDRACRTKIAGIPVGDFEKLFTEWDRWGWHRVTYYGDLKEPVFALADALGWKVVEEA